MFKVLLKIHEKQNWYLTWLRVDYYLLQQGTQIHMTAVTMAPNTSPAANKTAAIVADTGWPFTGAGHGGQGRCLSAS